MVGHVRILGRDAARARPAFVVWHTRVRARARSKLGARQPAEREGVQPSGADTGQCLDARQADRLPSHTRADMRMRALARARARTRASVNVYARLSVHARLSAHAHAYMLTRASIMYEQVV